jgi:hypothetical protein
MVCADGLAMCAALLFGEVEVREALAPGPDACSTQLCTPGCFSFHALARDYMREELTWRSSHCRGE